jgi:HSP20 family protein
MTAATPVFSIRREIDRLFDDAFGGAASRNGAAWAPPVDVRESQRELALTVEVPGVTPDQIEVTIDNGILTVRGEKREERQEGDEGQYHMLERTHGSFARSFQLPKHLDESKIEAKHEHGLLTIRIPKAALPQPKKIAISAPDNS